MMWKRLGIGKRLRNKALTNRMFLKIRKVLVES